MGLSVVKVYSIYHLYRSCFWLVDDLDDVITITNQGFLLVKIWSGQYGICTGPTLFFFKNKNSTNDIFFKKTGTVQMIYNKNNTNFLFQDMQDSPVWCVCLAGPGCEPGIVHFCPCVNPPLTHCKLILTIILDQLVHYLF